MCDPILGGALAVYGAKKHVYDPMRAAVKAQKKAETRMQKEQERQREQELQRRREKATESEAKVDTSLNLRTKQVNRALRTSMLGRRGFLIPTVGTGGSSGTIGGI